MSFRVLLLTILVPILVFFWKFGSATTARDAEIPTPLTRSFSRDTEPAHPGATLLVVNKNEDTVVFIDMITGDIRGKVKTGPNPHEVAVTPDGKRAYVSNYGSGRSGVLRSWLTILDIKSSTVIGDLDLKDPDTGTYLGAPHGLLITPDGKDLWVTAEESGVVARIRLPEENVAAVYPTGQRISHQVVPLPDGTKAYVANIGSGSVSVVDVPTGQVRTIACEAGTEGIDVTHDGRWVWATNRAANSISVIDTRKDEVVETLAAGRMPIRIKFTPDGKRALVSHALDGTVGIYDVDSRKRIRTIETGEAPIGILVLPDGSRAYVANTRANRVSVIDLLEWKVIDTLSPGENPDGLGLALPD
jgi:YVTN family beta-propeller protein